MLAVCVDEWMNERLGEILVGSRDGKELFTAWVKWGGFEDGEG